MSKREIKTGKCDVSGKEIKVGDIVSRLYDYEIRVRKGKPYAHILDGSGFHLKIEDVGRDFQIVNPELLKQ